MKRVRIKSQSLIKSLIENKCKTLHLSKIKLAKKYGVSYSTLKRWLRLESTVRKDIFDDLLNSYPEKKISSKIEILSPAWGQIKGGKRSVKTRIKKWGKEKYLKQLEVARKKRNQNPLLLWYEKIKLDPKKYEQFKKLKREHVLKILSSKECRSKSLKTLIKKYGEDYFKLLGAFGAKDLPLTKREKEIVKENLKANVPFDVHVPMNGWNVDFNYGNGFVEEVLGFRKSKSTLFYEIAKIYEKSKEIKKKFIVTSWLIKQYPQKKERFPIEAALWLIEKNMIPILIDIPEMKNLRLKIIKEHIIPSKKSLTDFYTKLISKHSWRGALIEKRKAMDKLEKKVHKILEKNNFSPEGKKILQTNYGTYVVTDNFFNSTAVFVSREYLKSLIGYGFIVKNLIKDKIKVMGILEKKVRIVGTDKTLTKKYIDMFFQTIEEFKKWAGGATVAHRSG